jgi:hypothetical protein
MRFQVLTATNIKMAVFWDDAPCGLVETDRRFRTAYCLKTKWWPHDFRREARPLQTRCSESGCGVTQQEVRPDHEFILVKKTPSDDVTTSFLGTLRGARFWARPSGCCINWTSSRVRCEDGKDSAYLCVVYLKPLHQMGMLWRSVWHHKYCGKEAVVAILKALLITQKPA